MRSEWAKLIQGSVAELELLSHGLGLSLLGCAASL